jgi:hypothetical protein
VWIFRSRNSARPSHRPNSSNSRDHVISDGLENERDSARLHKVLTNICLSVKDFTSQRQTSQAPKPPHAFSEMPNAAQQNRWDLMHPPDGTLRHNP